MESGSSGSFARVLLSQRGRVNSSPHIKPDVTPLKSKPTPPAINTPISPESPTPQSPTLQSPAPLSPTAKNGEGISYYEQLKALQKPKRSLPKSSNSPSETTKTAEVANGNGNGKQVAFTNLVDTSIQTEEIDSNTNSLEIQLSELQEELKNERETVASLKTLNNQIEAKNKGLNEIIIDKDKQIESLKFEIKSLNENWMGRSRSGSNNSFDRRSGSFENARQRYHTLGRIGSTSNPLLIEDLYDFGEKDSDENILYYDESTDDDGSVHSSEEEKRKIPEMSGSGRLTLRVTKKLESYCEVKVIEASGLEPRSSSGLSDPFVVCKILPSAMKPDEREYIKGQKTRVQKKTLNPLWNETLSLPVHDTKHDVLHCEIFDWNLVSSATPMGEVFVQLTELSTTPKDLWFRLQGARGSIRLRLTFISEKGDISPTDFNVKGATIQKLIEKMTSPYVPEKADNEYILDFLLTYRAFLTPYKLLEQLLARHRGPSPVLFPNASKFEKTLKAIQNSVGYVLNTWVEKTTDFNDTILQVQLNKFINLCPPSTYLAKAQKKLQSLTGSSIVHGLSSTSLSQILNRSVVEANMEKLLAVQAFQKHASLNQPFSPGTEKRLQFTDVEPAILAEQISLLEYELLKAVRASEFIKQVWNKPGKEHKAPNILKYTKWFNQISNWISTEIVKRTSPEERSVLIGNFIKMGVRFREIQNYNGVMEVISALHSAAISRLKQTWALIPNDLIEKFDQLSQLLSPTFNFQQYREACRSAKGTCIPYLGLWLQDLTFIDDANPDFIEGNIINFEKNRMHAKKVRELLDMLSTSYSFSPQDSIQQCVAQTEVWQENDIFRVSKLREGKHGDKDSLPSRFDSKAFDKITRALISGKENITVATLKMTSRDWQMLHSVATLMTLRQGTIIITEGANNNHIYKIKTGGVRVEKELEGNSNVVKVMSAGDLFGEMSTIGGNHGIASASVIANADVELYAMDVFIVHRLFDSESGLALRFYFRIAQTLCELLVATLNTTPHQNTHVEKKLEHSSSPSAAIPTDEKEEETETLLMTVFELDKNEVALKTYKAFLDKKVAFHGHFYITQRHVCFFSKSFGYKIKHVIKISEIAAISATKEERQLALYSKKLKLKLNFKTKTDSSEALELIKSLQQNVSKLPLQMPQPAETIRPRASTSHDNIDPQQDASQVFTMMSSEVSFLFIYLNVKDWDLMLKGAKSVTFKKDEVVIAAGEFYQRLYQISKGKCRVEIKANGEKQVVGLMGQGETFGENSLLRQNKGATASIVADEEVTVCIIEGYFINTLINMNQAFGARFFRYLAALLATRLYQREKQHYHLV